MGAVGFEEAVGERGERHGGDRGGGGSTQGGEFDNGGMLLGAQVFEEAAVEGQVGVLDGFVDCHHLLAERTQRRVEACPLSFDVVWWTRTSRM